MNWINRLNNRLQAIFESSTYDWKDPHNPDYDRQVAEDALYHTIGPLTNNPRWTETWEGHNDPVPGFVPGGQAPQWTQHEVMIACAGDPKYMGFEGNPRSPRYGDRGGAPLLRMAKSVAKQYGRNNWDFIMEVYSNGLVGLTRYTQPGYDESRSPFIRWLFGTSTGKGKVLPFIRSTMEAGIGSSQRARNAMGAINTLLAAKAPKQAQKIADGIGVNYRTTKSYDKTDENTYDQLSPEVYRAAINTAQALQTGDKDTIEANKQQLEQLKSKFDDELEMIPGAATGIDRAITNKDRDQTKLGIVSADAERGAESEGATIGATIASDEDSTEGAEYARQVIVKALQYAIEYDFRKILQKGSKYFEGEDIGGPLTINELRYYVRYHGLAEYPGKGNPRTNHKEVIREESGWCPAGCDPELEPLPAGGIWQSIWARNGYNQIGQTEIAQEMTEEVLEFNRAGVPTKREVKSKAGGKQEALSKVSVDRTLKGANAKVLVALRLVKSEMGDLDESDKSKLRAAGITLYEDMSPLDRSIFDMGYRAVIRMAARYITESL